MPRKSYQRRSNQRARELERRRWKTFRRRQNHAAIKPKRASANATVDNEKSEPIHGQ